MNAHQIAFALDIAIAAGCVALVASVLVAAVRGPVAWLVWPPIFVIALAALIGMASIARFAVSGFWPSVVAGVAWLVVAAAMAVTRWWLKRRLSRHLEQRLAALRRPRGVP